MCKCNEAKGCATCAKWTSLNSVSRVKWGICGHYNVGDRLRITMGNIIERNERIESTSDTRCVHYEKK